MGEPLQLERLSVRSGLVAGKPMMRLEFEHKEQEFYLYLTIEAAQAVIGAMRDGVRVALGGG